MPETTECKSDETRQRVRFRQLVCLCPIQLPVIDHTAAEKFCFKPSALEEPSIPITKENLTDRKVRLGVDFCFYWHHDTEAPASSSMSILLCQSDLAKEDFLGYLH